MCGGERDVKKRGQAVTRSGISPYSGVSPGKDCSGSKAVQGLPPGRKRRIALSRIVWALLLSAITTSTTASASDVSVAAGPSVWSCRKGDLVKYTITAAGASAKAATIVFPLGLTLIRPALPANCVADAGSPTTVTCGLSGAGAVVMWVEAMAVGTYGIVAGAVGSDYDPDLSNNSAQATLTVSEPVGSVATAYYTLPPCRVIDTRAGSQVPPGNGPPSMPGNGAARNFVVAGRCGIPSDARSISVNAAVWGPVTTGDMAIFAAGGTSSAISMLFWKANILALANAGIVQLGSGGAVTVRVNGTGTVNFFLDVNGYFK
jgi:hypothetical protein